MNHFKKLAGQTLIYGVPTIVGRLLNYFLVPLYTYNFIPTDYGTINEMYAYVSFLLIVLTYGMETALFNFSRLNENKQNVYSTIVTCVSFTSFLFITLVILFSQSIANVIMHPDHPEYIVWFALILGLDAISAIAFAKLREQGKATKFAVIRSINISVNILLNVFFLWICKEEYEKSSTSLLGQFYNPKIGIGYAFISNLAASALVFLIFLPTILQSKFKMDFALLKRIFPYALPLLIAGLPGMINETADRIFLRYLLPEDIALDQVGIYGACYKISIIMTIFIQTFRFAAEPFFFNQANSSNAKGLYAQIMDYFVIICMIIFLGTMLNISLISHFVGKEYRVGLGVVPILLLANFCLGVFFNLSIWYKLTGQTKFGAWLTFIGAAITIFGNVVFIKKYGYMASAWATFICYAIMVIISYFLGEKHYPVNYNLKKIFGYVALALSFYFISIKIEFNSSLIDLGVKNVYLIAFLLIVFIFERKKFKLIKSESSNNQ